MEEICSHILINYKYWIKVNIRSINFDYRIFEIIINNEDFNLIDIYNNNYLSIVLYNTHINKFIELVGVKINHIGTSTEFNDNVFIMGEFYDSKYLNTDLDLREFNELSLYLLQEF